MEYPIKAAFLINFARFVEWPGDAFASPTSSFVIAVAGSPTMVGILLDLAKAERIGDRVVEVVAVTGATPPARCHILYIASSVESNRLGKLLAPPRRSGVLTVGDSEMFVSRGGIIRFFVADNRVRFEISLDNAGRSALRIGSQLLQLAKLVGRPREP